MIKSSFLLGSILPNFALWNQGGARARRAARQWLDERGYESTLDYVRAMAIRVRSRWLSRLSTRSIAAQADVLA